MESIIIVRWTKMNYTIHCLGFALTLKFYDLHYLETPSPGGFDRKPSNLDKEVMMGLMHAFPKIVENLEEQKVLQD